MRALVALLLLLLVVVGLACFVPTVELGNKACDGAHPCIDGYFCSPTQTCVLQGGSDDGGEGDGSVDGGSCVVSACSGSVFLPCDNGFPGGGITCSAPQVCEPAPGCVAACSSPTFSCSGTNVCDRAGLGCVPSPACTIDSQCSGGHCVSGACVPTPSAVAQAVPSGGTPQYGCYTADAGPSDASTATVTLTGLVLTAYREPTATTIGNSLAVYLAADFIASDTPTAIVTSKVYDGGLASDGGAVPAGFYTLEDLPVGEDIVVSVTSSDTNQMPTHHFLTLRPDQATTTVQWQLVSYARDLWDSVVHSAGVIPDDRLAGVVGQAVDCTGTRLSGATAALDTPSRAWYTDPVYFVVDPAATATSTTGRFFFFNVPAVPLNAVVGARSQSQGVVYSGQAARAMPASISVLSMRPLK